MDNEVREVAETQQTETVNNGKRVDLNAGDYAILALAAFGAFHGIKWVAGKTKEGIGKLRDKKASKKPKNETVVEGSAEEVDPEENYREE